MIEAVRRSLLTTVAFLLIPLLSGCDTGNASLGLIGKPAPALALPGQPLAALRGRVVVLNFWASWCPPCLAELPSLTQLQQQMPAVTVLAVSFDRNPDAYARFLQVHHVALRTALDSSGRSNQAYGTTMPPETFIIDRDGVVRRKFIGAPANGWTDPEIESYLRALQ
ncbi:TlpA disulfide reductase family protein [Acidipila sp. EB88]|uniref:TlpA family protein disulfide reductase n=1 Tax=Acidipila sp. EB88 TaxID=2305226 RepID=UPI000F5DBB72|nr:TlpA disulfide reductase family protein [Acidipila sp. EB88]RRA47155.1 TlpA family protein disulfide reductase [Acidipila sp. EB88]